MGKKKAGKQVKMNMTEFLGDYAGRAALPSGPAARADDDDGRNYGRRAERREPEGRSEGDNNWRGGGGGFAAPRDDRYGGGGGYGGGGDRDRDRYQSPSDQSSSWRSGLSSQDDERYARREQGSAGGYGSRDAPPARDLGQRKKLVLKQRTVPKDGAAAATASSIFGGAKPVQVKEAPLSEEARIKKEWEEKFKKSSAKMQSKYGSAAEMQADEVAKGVAAVAIEEPKEPEEEVPKPPSPEEIAAEAALEVIASKKVGADLVSWVKSQEGLMGKLLIAEMLAAVLNLDTEADFSFKSIQPGQYGDLLQAIPKTGAQQVEAVFAAQDYCGTVKFPKDDKGSALVYKLFIELYKHEYADDTALETWKDDYKRLSDNKQKAILQTLKFFEWLLAEEDDSEEDSGDEDN